MNRPLLRAICVGGIVALVVVALTGCWRPAQVVDLTGLHRDPCAILDPVHVEYLDELALEDCDHAGRLLIFPDGAEMEAPVFGHVSKVGLERTSYKGSYVLANYGGAGVIAIWTQCLDGEAREPKFFGDPEIVKRQKELRPKEHETAYCEPIPHVKG